MSRPKYVYVASSWRNPMQPHLELGWFVGQSVPTAILLDGPSVTPELMYRMVDHVTTSLLDLLAWLGVED